MLADFLLVPGLGLLKTKQTKNKLKKKISNFRLLNYFLLYNHKLEKTKTKNLFFLNGEFVFFKVVFVIKSKSNFSTKITNLFLVK